MKRLFMAIAIFFMIVGCASIRFNPETGEIKYTRIGDQHIQGFEVKRTNGDIRVKMEAQQSNADALTEAIRVISILAVPK